MSNFILTGHMGLIGSSLLKSLVSKGDNPVLTLDRRNPKQNLDHFNDVAYINYAKIDEQVDVVYHLASLCSIRECIKHPRDSFESDVVGILEVLEFCRENNVPKIVYTSSTRVLYEEANPYTANKKYAEELIRSYAATYDIEYVIIRPSTVYGPFEDLTNRLVHRWCVAATQNAELKIFGDKNKSLDFTYVEDFVTALMKLSSASNEAFNIGSGTETKVKDVGELIIDMIGKGRLTYHDAEIQQPQNVVIDTDFPCNTSIEEGIRKTVEFYKKMD